MERTAGLVNFLHRQAAGCGLVQDNEQEMMAAPGRLLAFLLVLALVVRGVMALLLTSVCDDAQYYLLLGKALNAGDLDEVFVYLSLNIYPPVLAGLNRLGGDCVMLAKLWGVIISGLAVLPLYGFVRRLFDSRIAAAAGLLYALHPGLIELSAEPVREPTFWFLFLLGLYLSCRSVEERRWPLFLLNGVVTALAIHTRTEGWLLVPVLMYWAALEGWSSRSLRPRLAAGTVLCLLMTPALILAVNVTLLRNHSRWELGRMEHISMGLVWLSSLAGTSPEEAPPATVPPADPAAEISTTETTATEMTATEASASQADGNRTAAVEVTAVETAAVERPGRLKALLGYIGMYFRAVCSSIGPLYLLLTGLGMYYGRKELFRGKIMALFLLSVAVMLAVCAYAGFTIVTLHRMQINDRYFFTALLALLPFTAWGLLASIDWFRSREWCLPPQQHRRMLVAPAMLGVLLLTGTVDAWTSRHGRREHEARLGEWLSENYGPVETVASNRAGVRAGYFVNSRLPEAESLHHSLQELVAQKKPQLVIIGTRRLEQPYRDMLIQNVAQSASPPLQQAAVPEEFADFVILQSPEFAADRMATRPDAQAVH